MGLDYLTFSNIKDHKDGESDSQGLCTQAHMDLLDKCCWSYQKKAAPGHSDPH